MSLNPFTLRRFRQSEYVDAAATSPVHESIEDRGRITLHKLKRFARGMLKVQ
jgi:hypothetical protein